MHSDYGGIGVGSALIGALEKMAIKAGLTDLHLEASLNAVPFYEKRDYSKGSVGEITLRRSGVRMASVKMRKELDLSVSS